jgi:hypothetical protein
MTQSTNHVTIIGASDKQQLNVVCHVNCNRGVPQIKMFQTVELGG